MYVRPVLAHVYAVAAVTIGTFSIAHFDDRKPNTSADLDVYESGIIFCPATPHSAFVSASFVPLVPGGNSLISLTLVLFSFTVMLRVDIFKSAFNCNIFEAMESLVVVFGFSVSLLVEGWR